VVFAHRKLVTSACKYAAWAPEVFHVSESKRFVTLSLVQDKVVLVFSVPESTVA